MEPRTKTVHAELLVKEGSKSWKPRSLGQPAALPTVHTVFPLPTRRNRNHQASTCCIGLVTARSYLCVSRL